LLLVVMFNCVLLLLSSIVLRLSGIYIVINCLMASSSYLGLTILNCIHYKLLGFRLSYAD